MPTRRSLTLVALLLAPPALAAAGTPLGAQIFKVPKNVVEPAFWTSVDVGYFQLQDVADSKSNSVWRFGNSVQYRASLEYAIGRGSSLGVTGTWARMPLVYQTLDGSPVCGSAACGTLASSVNAHADVASLLATFHGGGGEGFHAVLDGALGATRYSGFRTDRGSLVLSPTSDLDPAFSIGSGVGYATSARTEFTLVQEYGNIFHQRGTLPNDVRTNAQQLTTRLGVRFGFGARRPR